MPRRSFLLVLTALAVSLWFHWRKPQDLPDSPSASAAPGPQGPSLTGDIDFSGTGFSDEAWTLEPARAEQRIPQQLPDPGDEPAKPLPVPPPVGWDLDGKVRLEPGSRP